MTMVLIAFLAMLVASYQPASARDGCVTAESISGQVLHNHVIDTLQAEYVTCATHCSNLANCRSINLYMDRNICVLNNATHLSHPEDMSNAAGGLYMIFFTHPYVCSHRLCCKNNNCTSVCLINADGLSYRCKGNCDKPLGLQDKRIAHSAITASSVYINSPCCKGYQGRLHNNETWAVASSSVGQYLQVDLGRVMFITKVATQGHPREAVGQWVKSYTISHSLDGNKWFDYQDEGRVKVFLANTDCNTVVANTIAEKVRARFIKILVQSWENHIAMRAELYGCSVV